MPICPSCGESFSGFSIGSQTAAECADCQKAKAQVAMNAPSAASKAQRASGRTILQSVPPVTRVIIGLNVLVYVAMGLSGVSWTEPSVLNAIHWGADFGPLTFSGEWWRQFSNMFVHFGIIHIALNMWCLWNLGSALEPLMGTAGFSLTYLFSGLAASATSVAWSPWRASAGASGAIFGLAGAFVTFLLMKKLPIEKSLVQKNLKSMGLFIFYNLLYGAANSHIDNSAHLGGLVAGFILGALVPASVRFSAAKMDARLTGLPIDAGDSGDTRQQRLVLIAVGCSIALVAGLYVVRSRNIPAAQYGKAVSLESAGQTDRAISEMKKAVELQPENVLAQLLVGDWLLLQNNPAAAIPYLEQARQLEPDAGVIRHNLALAYLGAGQPRAAVSEISQTVGKNQTESWEGSFILGVAAEQDGNYRLAAQNLNSVVQAKPDFQEARDELARVSAVASSRSSAADPKPVQVPYAKLLMKSAAWPYYP
ncbi:MAG: rhomboid family intramembrane serine protease [Candidatus Acidiferrales bacterium]